jgi:hypothetical protein
MVMDCCDNACDSCYTQHRFCGVYLLELGHKRALATDHAQALESTSSGVCLNPQFHQHEDKH